MPRKKVDRPLLCATIRACTQSQPSRQGANRSRLSRCKSSLAFVAPSYRRPKATSLPRAFVLRDFTLVFLRTSWRSRLELTQPFVSRAERGRESIGDAYVSRVLDACGLPADWQPSKRRATRRVDKRRTHA